MEKLFKVEDIKAGYLLRFWDAEEGRMVNMTVAPAVVRQTPLLLAALPGNAEPACGNGRLACYGEGHYWPLSMMDDELTCGDGQLRCDEVYGYTVPRFLLDNCTRGRELLWRREEAGEDTGRKAMLSQPMAGKTDQEIAATRNRAVAALEGRGYTVVNTLFTDAWYSKEAMARRGVVQVPLCFLAKSLENMSLCHTAYFCKGWEQARGCRIEHEAAKAYGLEIIYEE